MKMSGSIVLSKIREPLSYAVAPHVASLQRGLLGLEPHVGVVEPEPAVHVTRSNVSGASARRLNASVHSSNRSTFASDIGYSEIPAASRARFLSVCIERRTTLPSAKVQTWKNRFHTSESLPRIRPPSRTRVITCFSS